MIVCDLFAVCDSLPVQSNGSFELSGRNVDGATAELKCDVGFNVSDSDFIITCQSDGSWTEIDSTCLRSKYPHCLMYCGTTFLLSDNNSRIYLAVGMGQH